MNSNTSVHSCFTLIFFCSQLAVTFVVCLVYIKDARDNKLIETSVMFFCFLAGKHKKFIKTSVTFFCFSPVS